MIKENAVGKSPARIEFISGGDHEHYIGGMGWGACLNATINLCASCRAAGGSAGALKQTDEMAGHIVGLYKTGGVRLKMLDDYPPNSGLGGSAAHAAAIIKALDKMHGIKRTPKEIALLAYDIERRKLGVDGGYQDQFATAYGGFNYMVFRPDGDVEVERIPVSKKAIEKLESMSLLVYIPRSVSGDSIQKSMKSRSSNNLEIMKKKRELCGKGRDALIAGNVDEFIRLVGMDYELRKEESPLVCNSSTNEIERMALENGAAVCKFLGSGGGGCALIFSGDKAKVANALKATPASIRVVVGTARPMRARL